MSDSITRLFITRRSTFSQNSQKLLKRPPTSFACLDDGLDGVAAYVLHRGKAEANGVAVGRELRAGDLHVRRLDGDAHFAALADVLHDVVGLGGFRREQRGHELDRVMRLEISGLIGHQRVRRGVRLIESVAGELRHLVEDLARDAFGCPSVARRS